MNVINPAATNGTKGNVVQVGNLSSGLGTKNIDTYPRIGKNNPTKPSPLLDLYALADGTVTIKFPIAMQQQ